jgi:hypothetical protein
LPFREPLDIHELEAGGPDLSGQPGMLVGCRLAIISDPKREHPILDFDLFEEWDCAREARP